MIASYVFTSFIRNKKRIFFLTIGIIISVMLLTGVITASKAMGRDMISRNLDSVYVFMDEDRLIAVRERLLKAISDLKLTADENRFEQELIYYLEKLDITEEKVRLENHLNYFLEELNGEVSNGKKLGFISQEIGREVNTIGSKANFAPMQKMVVQMKDELEKIKEQLLNVL